MELMHQGFVLWNVPYTWLAWLCYRVVTRFTNQECYFSTLHAYHLTSSFFTCSSLPKLSQSCHQQGKYNSITTQTQDTKESTFFSAGLNWPGQICLIDPVCLLCELLCVSDRKDYCSYHKENGPVCQVLQVFEWPMEAKVSGCWNCFWARNGIFTQPWNHETPI